MWAISKYFEELRDRIASLVSDIDSVAQNVRLADHQIKGARAHMVTAAESIHVAAEAIGVEHGAIEARISMLESGLGAVVRSAVLEALTERNEQAEYWRTEASRWQKLAEGNYGALQTERAIVSKLTQRLKR